MEVHAHRTHDFYTDTISMYAGRDLSKRFYRVDVSRSNKSTKRADGGPLVNSVPNRITLRAFGTGESVAIIRDGHPVRKRRRSDRFSASKNAAWRARMTAKKRYGAIRTLHALTATRAIVYGGNDIFRRTALIYGPRTRVLNAAAESSFSRNA